MGDSVGVAGREVGAFTLTHGLPALGEEGQCLGS